MTQGTAIKIGDTVAWADVPDGAMVRHQESGAHLVIGTGGAFLAHYEGAPWLAPDDTGGPSRMGPAWRSMCESRVTIIALGLTGSESAADLQRMAEVFDGSGAAMTNLTFRQEQVLAFIRSCCADRGRPPTLREICNHLKVASTNAVADHLKALEKKGYLTRGAKGTSHNIRLADGQSAQQRALGYLADLQATPLTAHQRELLRRAQENLGAGEQVQGGVDASS